MYPKKANLKPGVYFAGSNSDLLRNQLLVDTNINPIKSYVSNSSALSEYMLNHYVKKVYGGYLFHDSIHLNVTIDWNWVRKTVGTVRFSNVSLSSTDLNKYFGIKLDLGTFIGKNQKGTILIPKQSIAKIASGLQIPPRILRFLNSSSFSIFNRTINLNPVNGKFNLSAIILSNLPSQFNYSITLPQLNSSISTFSRRVTFNAVTEDLCFYDANIETVLGKFKVKQACFALNVLPSGSVVYNFNQPSKYTIMHNSTSPHALPCFSGELVQSAYQMCSPYGAASLYYAKNHPLPQTTKQALDIKVILSLLTSIFILVPLCYIPASFISFLVKERVSKSKHLQIVSSVSPYLYWTAG